MMPRAFLSLLAAAAFSTAARADVVVTGAWVRGTVAGQQQTAAYMSISSDRDVHLSHAASPVAGSSQVHAMKMNGETMTMRPVASLAIPAGRRVELDETGYHLMLMGLKRPLLDADRVALELQFVDDGTGAIQVVRIDAPVRPLGSAAKHD
jgi:copper(I)-binding protein